ncbi:hypothetical protein T261_03088 [Streptomyces lydicus]|nr:hypothetical protein T261_03088 [Streptomyces lydicus]
MLPGERGLSGRHTPSLEGRGLIVVALVKIVCAPSLLLCTDLCARTESYDPLRVVGTG